MTMIIFRGVPEKTINGVWLLNYSSKIPVYTQITQSFFYKSHLCTISHLCTAWFSHLCTNRHLCTNLYIDEILYIDDNLYIDETIPKNNARPNFFTAIFFLFDPELTKIYKNNERKMGWSHLCTDYHLCTISHLCTDLYIDDN